MFAKIDKYINKLKSAESVKITNDMGISAKIITDSQNQSNNRLTTYELEYPSFIHDEIMTNRFVSKNKHKLSLSELELIKARDEEITWINRSNKLRYGNMAKTILSLTDYDNNVHFSIKELADVMISARDQNTPVILDDGEYHLPYITPEIMEKCIEYTLISGIDPISLALKISASLCYQITELDTIKSTLFSKENIPVPKSINYDQLITAQSLNSRLFKHQARPITNCDIIIFNNNLINKENKKNRDEMNLYQCITHTNNNGSYCSGSFKGWIQHRNEMSENIC